MIRKILSRVLGFSQVLFDAFATLRQIVDFTPNLFIKGMAGFASTVEGEIYLIYIYQGLGLFNLLIKKALFNYLVIKAFEDILISIEDSEKNFIKEISDFFSHVENIRDKDVQSLLEKIAQIKKGSDSGINEQLVTAAFEEYNQICKDQLDIYKERFESLKTRFDKIKEDNKEYLTAIYKATLANLKNATSAGLDTEAKGKLEEKLKKLQKILVSLVHNAQNGVPVSDTYISPDRLKALQEAASEVNKKLWALRLSMLFGGIAGVASGVVTFYTFPAVFLSLGLFIGMPQLLMATVCLLTILTVISYGILIYNSAANLILNEKLSKWWKNLNNKIGNKYHPFLYIILVVAETLYHIVKNIINWLGKNSDENIFSYLLRIILVLAILIFTGMASVTVAYTIFTLLAPYVNVTICVLVALFVTSGDLLFNLQNSLNAITLFHGLSLNKFIDSIKQRLNNLQAQSQQENYLQIGLNLIRLPLEILRKLFMSAILLVHAAASAVATDKFPGCANWVGFLINLIMEYLTDFAAIFGKKEVGNDRDHGHDHDHGGIINSIAKIIFFGPATLLGISNYLLSQLNRLSSNPQLKVLGFAEAIKMDWHKFDILHLHVDKKADYQQQDNNFGDKEEKALDNIIPIKKAINLCDREIKRLRHPFFSNELAARKLTIFANWRTNLEVIGTEISAGTVQEKRISDLLKKAEDEDTSKTLKIHRYSSLFNRPNKPTQSSKAAKEVGDCLQRCRA